ncbi:hypothetical protein SAMN04515618_104235 [Collimonas sp. OK307]|nr:hypothetical protein SAMN04515618_104235 [Collimonas sp. OK307]
MDKKSPVHVLDSHSMPIVLDELDTVEDFAQHLKFKGREIDEMPFVCYCEEED